MAEPTSTAEQAAPDKEKEFISTEDLTLRGFDRTGVCLPVVPNNAVVYKENPTVQRIREDFRNRILRDPRYELALEDLSNHLPKDVDGVRNPLPVIRIAGMMAIQAEDLRTYCESDFEEEPRYRHPPLGSLHEVAVQKAVEIHHVKLAPNTLDWSKRNGRPMDIHFLVIATLILSDMIRRIDTLENEFENKSDDDVLEDFADQWISNKEPMESVQLDEPGPETRCSVEWEQYELKGFQSAWKPNLGQTNRGSRAGESRPQKRKKSQATKVYGQQTSQAPGIKTAANSNRVQAGRQHGSRAANMNARDSILLESEDEYVVESKDDASYTGQHGVEGAEQLSEDGGDIEAGEKGEDEVDGEGLSEKEDAAEEEAVSEEAVGEEEEAAEERETTDGGEESDADEFVMDDSGTSHDESGDESSGPEIEDGIPRERFVRTRLSGAQANIKNLQARNASLEKQAGTLRAQVGDLKEQVQDRDQKLAELQADVQKHKKKRKRGEEKLDERAAEIKRLRQLLRDNRIEFDGDSD